MAELIEVTSSLQQGKPKVEVIWSNVAQHVLTDWVWNDSISKQSAFLVSDEDANE